MDGVLAYDGTSLQHDVVVASPQSSWFSFYFNCCWCPLVSMSGLPLSLPLSVRVFAILAIAGSHPVALVLILLVYDLVLVAAVVFRLHLEGRTSR